MVKIVTVLGARPQFIKAAMLSRLLRDRVREIIVHTGQHYDDNMSAVFFRQLQIPQPDYHLGVGSDTHASQTARMMVAIENVLVNESPDWVLVYGDTNSTLAASLAAAKRNVPIAHVEAGLRSFNKTMPEEINRLITDHLSTLLFCPTREAGKNLRKEGIIKNVHLVGDIMFDSVLHFKDTALKTSSILDRLALARGQYYLATIHRAENTDDPKRLSAILETLVTLDRMVILPLHPRTDKRIKQWKLDHLLRADTIRVVEALDYFDMLALESQAKAILTDSGGVQKEAYMVGVPCITLRDETEWTETVRTGWNRIVGVNKRAILDAVAKLRIPRRSPPIFGDGRAAEKIVHILTSFQPAPIRPQPL